MSVDMNIGVGRRIGNQEAMNHREVLAWATENTITASFSYYPVGNL